MIIGTLYGVVAMCFVLIYKSTQIVNFAQGEFLLIGAWTCWWLLTSMKVPFWLGFPLTLAFMTAFGVLLQVLVLRPMIGEPIISVIMVTIGLSIFFQAMGLNVQTPYIMSMLISLVIMAGFAWFFKFSRMGLAMRATAFNQQVAQSLGISVRTVFAAAWAISAVVSALAGVGMYTGDAGYIKKENGHLVVIDRVKDLATTSGGTRFSPQFIENKLKFSPFIAEAVVLGHDRPYLAAIVCVRYSIVSKWAEQRSIAFTNYTSLSSRPEIYRLLREEVEKVNATLPSRSACASSCCCTRSSTPTTAS